MNPLTMTLAALLALASPLSAQITANMDVFENGASLGIITIELDHVKAPVATANFIGLATGKFPWIDSTTGVVRQNTPYYNGIIFHRVIAGFMNQTGSQKGDGSDGPGYNFLDGAEVTNGLNHDNAFVISMANSGPNSNGSQIFLTAAPASHLNGKHIVFGKVATGASQTLVTTINNVPVNSNNRPLTDVTINSITVNYNGVTFDPCDQGLPVVSAPTLTSAPLPGSASIFYSQPTPSQSRVSSSTDLVSWTFDEQRYLDASDSPLTSYALDPGNTGGPTRFYSTTLVTYSSSALGPSSLANRTLTAITSVDAAVPFVFVFDANGITGTWTYLRAVGPLSGTITDSLFLPDGYGCRLIMILSGINFDRWDFRRLGFDSSNPTHLLGRQTGSATYTNPSVTGSLDISGTHTLTR